VEGASGEVREFSRASINRTAFRAYEGCVYFLTLTYPAAWSEDPETPNTTWKPSANAWRDGTGVPYLLEARIPEEGAPHFHLPLFVPYSPESAESLRRFVASAWYEACGEICEEHLRAGTGVERIRSWRNATSYAERYVAKRKRFPKGLKISKA
jgi:hypothetical protein